MCFFSLFLKKVCSTDFKKESKNLVTCKSQFFKECLYNTLIFKTIVTLNNHNEIIHGYKAILNKRHILLHLFNILQDWPHFASLRFSSNPPECFQQRPPVSFSFYSSKSFEISNERASLDRRSI